MKAFFKMGIYACPEAASTLAALHKFENEGVFDRDDRILLYLTGNAMKYFDIMQTGRKDIHVLDKNGKKLTFYPNS